MRALTSITAASAASAASRAAFQNDASPYTFIRRDRSLFPDSSLVAAQTSERSCIAILWRFATHRIVRQFVVLGIRAVNHIQGVS